MQVERIQLKKNESVPRPDCFRSDGSQCQIYGPGVVEVIRWPDGGVTLKIVSGCRA